MTKIVNLSAILQARARLKALAHQYPELLGQSTTDEWEAILSEALSGTAQRQQALKQRRHAQGQVRVTLWTSQEEREALRDRYPGPRGGIDWQTIIMTALERKP